MWCDWENNIHQYSNAPADTLCKPANYHCESGGFVPNANLLNLKDYDYSKSGDCEKYYWNEKYNEYVCDYDYYDYSDDPGKHDKPDDPMPDSYCDYRIPDDCDMYYWDNYSCKYVCYPDDYSDDPGEPDWSDDPIPDSPDDGDDPSDEKEKSVLQTIDQALKTAYNYMKDLIQELKTSKSS